jgi:NADH dehydrogenase [ubiquinone] 1 alpha subcomplex assembly factor 3
MMTGRLLNAKGQWEVQERAWGVLELLYPKPGMFRVSLQGFGKNGN